MSPPARSAGIPAVKRLPAGRHGIPAEVVRDHQRQRLFESIAEISNREGYARTSVNDIAAHAAVSKKTFYQLFETKEECLLGAHQEYCCRLLATIDDACTEGGGWPSRAKAAVRVALAFLASDLIGAEFLATTVLCVGSEGARRHYELIDAIASRLRDLAPALSVDYPRAEWSAAVSMAAMVGQAANLGDRAAILDLEDDFSAMLLALTMEPA